MPKGPKGEKRPADVVGAAVKVMQIATGEIEETTDDGKNKAAVELGRKGGKARAANMTPEQRRKWAKALSEWRTPEGGKPVYCASGSCYLGYVGQDSPDLLRLDGSVITSAPNIACLCSAGRTWHRG